MKRHEEVVKFSCGLFGKSALIEHVYDLWVQTMLQEFAQENDIEINSGSKSYTMSQK